MTADQFFAAFVLVLFLSLVGIELDNPQGAQP